MKKNSVLNLDQETIACVKNKIAMVMCGHAIKKYSTYLFGSYAKKKATQYSDVDIMVVVDVLLTGKENFRLTGDLLFALTEIPYAVDVIVKNKMDYLEEKTIKGAFVRSVANECIRI